MLFPKHLSGSSLIAACASLCVAAVACAAEPGATDVARLLAAGQSAEALADIDRLLRRTPSDVQLRFQRGVALNNLDRNAEASIVFEKLIEDRPDMAPAYNNLAVIEGARGDDEAARSLLTKAVQIKPAYPVAQHNLGDVFMRLAIDAYAKAAKYDKTDGAALTKIAALRALAAAPAMAASPNPTSTAAAAVLATAASTPSVPPKPSATITFVKAGAVAGAPAAVPAASAPDTAAVDVAAIVRNWADDWSRRDSAAYLGYYAPEFAGRAANHAAWVQERGARLANAKRIAVTLAGLTVRVNGNTAEARFRQSYASDTAHTDDDKALTLVRTLGGRWLITRETVVR